MKHHHLLHNAAFILLLLIICSLGMHAQARFKVLAIRGNVTIGTKALVLGQQLKAVDKVSVPKGGYVSLAHVNGRTVELRKAGTYNVADIDKAASKKAGSATDKFAAYVLSELTEVQEPISFTDARRTNMKTTGSVDRAAGNDVNLWDSVLAVVGAPGELQALAVVQSNAISTGSEFTVIMPRHTRILGDTVAFVWHPTPKAKSFRIVIVDNNNSVVFSTEVVDTQYIASMLKLDLKPGKLYYWHVESASDPGYKTDEFALYQLAGGERTSTEELIAEISADVDPSEAAIGQLILASAFEDMGLTYNAHRAYAAAVEMAPDVPNYKRMYAEFLKRQGLNLEAYVAYR